MVKKNGNTKDNENDKYAITLSKAWALSKSWKRAAIWWRVLDHLFAILSFAASITVVYISGISADVQNVIIFLSSLAALLTVVGFACNPTKYMSNYRAAFQVLNAALVSNIDDKGELINVTVGYEEIINAIQQGERYIGRTFEVVVDIEAETSEKQGAAQQSP